MMNYGNEHINQLVMELSKAKPNVELVKAKTGILGIPYSSDIIILMSDVLVYISELSKQKPPLKEKTV